MARPRARPRADAASKKRYVPAKESMATENDQAPLPSGSSLSKPRVLTAAMDPGAAAAAGATSRWSAAQHGHCLLRAVSPSLSPRAVVDFTACGAVAIQVNVREVQLDGAVELTVTAGVDEEQQRCAKRSRLSIVPGSSANVPDASCRSCTLGCGQWWAEMELPVVRHDKTQQALAARGIGIAAVVAPLDQHGRVLLTRRPRHMRTFPGCWVLPGGSVDPGESTLSAALRELREETGLHPARLPSPQPFAMWEVRALWLLLWWFCRLMCTTFAIAEQLPLSSRTLACSHTQR